MVRLRRSCVFQAAPGYASCQRGLRQSRDRFCRHCVRPGHARPSQIAGAVAGNGRTAADGENGRSVHARAIGLPVRGARTTNPSATLSLATRRPQAAPSSTGDASRRRSAAQHASRPRSAATRPATLQLDPVQSVELKFATKRILPTKWSVELLVPKRQSAREKAFADQLRNVRPHFSRNSAGALSIGLVSAQ